MGKVNFMLDEDVRQELNALVPPPEAKPRGERRAPPGAPPETA
jgi:hypothetical protein